MKTIKLNNIRIKQFRLNNFYDSVQQKDRYDLMIVYAPLDDSGNEYQQKKFYFKEDELTTPIKQKISNLIAFAIEKMLKHEEIE